MINYKQILEAVNRGIKFALDDFEDQNDIQGQVNSKVNHGHGIKEWLILQKELVDLSLPSGTLWCKYNLDVDPNLLNTSEDWYGDYYAWGELEANKPKFSWSTYKFGEERLLTKYCYDKQYSADYIFPRTDDLKELLPKDDAAYLNKKLYNYKFHIPTKELCEELINYTNNYWVNNYDPNKTIHCVDDDEGIKGLNGRVFVGLNGNTLFIPAAGYRNKNENYSLSSFCYLWSSSLYLNIPTFAYDLVFGSGCIYMGYLNRCNGYNIRPVINL